MRGQFIFGEEGKSRTTDPLYLFLETGGVECFKGPLSTAEPFLRGETLIHESAGDPSILAAPLHFTTAASALDLSVTPKVFDRARAKHTAGKEKRAGKSARENLSRVRISRLESNFRDIRGWWYTRTAPLPPTIFFDSLFPFWPRTRSWFQYSIGRFPLSLFTGHVFPRYPACQKEIYWPSR